MPVSLELCLPPDDNAPGVARHALAGLDPYMPKDTRDTLSLLVSELVTNSVLHAGLQADDWVSVQLRIENDRIRVVVRDPGSGFSSPRETEMHRSDRIGGWGLMLVERLAQRWGTDNLDSTAVWFELDPTRRAK